MSSMRLSSRSNCVDRACDWRSSSAYYIQNADAAEIRAITFKYAKHYTRDPVKLLYWHADRPVMI